MSEAQASKKLPFEGTRAQRRAHRPMHAVPSSLAAEAIEQLPVAMRKVPVETPAVSPNDSADEPTTSPTSSAAEAEAFETALERPFPTRAELRARREKSGDFPSESAEDSTPPPTGLRKAALVVREYAIILVIALTISAFIRAFLFQAFWIPSGSMKNTLEIGDSVAVSRLTPRFFDIQRGDVVVFHDSQSWLTPHAEQQSSFYWVTKPLEFLGLRPESSEQFLVKRVIGTPGDNVICCNSLDQLLVNGKPISEPYLAEGSYNSLQPFNITVPAGKLWVMGDNRNNSADSRAHQDVNGGMVNIEDVVGKVFGVVWPYSHWKNPTNHEPFADIPSQPVKSN
ncbi:MAG: signal peptidase I [Actinomycetaceae bacterium]|nr:signal peptidase I [Actinomycetaceae bacterium]